MKRALILGANGRIGRLLRTGLNGVTPIWQARADADLCFDIMTDTDALRAACARADVILTLAGTTHHSDAGLADLNVALPRKVLDNAQGKHVFLMSSAAVYGAQSGEMFEGSALRPGNAYGTQKVAMEVLAKAHKAPCTILRLGNVVGADALLGTGQDNFTLHSFPDGTTPLRSYIGPRLLGHVLGALMARDALPPILNIATPEPVSMADLLRAAGHSWTTAPAPESAIACVSLNTALLQSLVPLPKNASRAPALVSDWQSVKDAP